MSIRNKRLIKEIPRLEDYNLIWDEDWQSKEMAVITTTRHNMLISLTLKHNYPFHSPILRVHPNFEKTGIEYISWFLKQNRRFKKMKDKLNIVIPCICCYSITCSWTPGLGIKDMIHEFDTHYEMYESLVKLQLIYNKIRGFDNLIYQRISHFLY
jgi:hypothetical protein